LVLAQHFLRAWRAGALANLFGAYDARSDPTSGGSFWAIVPARIALHHGLVLTAGLVVWVAWTLVRRSRDAGSWIVLGLIAGQTLWLARFPSEAAFHEYRTYWYVAPAAFATADLAASLGRRLARSQRVLGLLPASVVLVALLVRAPGMLALSRIRAGSTSDLSHDPHTSMMVAAQVARALTERHRIVLLGASFADRLESFWLVDRASLVALTPVETSWARVHFGPPAILIDTATLTNEAQWTAVARQGAVLLLRDRAFVDLARRPSIEAAAIRQGRGYGPLLRWLRAPATGPTRLVPAPRAVARAFAQAIGAPASVARRIDAGDRPLLDAIGRDWTADQEP